MTIKEAIMLFSKEVSGKRVVGYWVSEKGVILNTKSVPELDGFYGPSQFVVSNEGKVYGTNPLVDDFDSMKYHKL